MRKRTHSIIGFAITGLILCQAAAGWGATLSGRVYEGNVGDETKPLSRVTVALYGSNNSGQQGMYITSTTTNSDGWYGLEVESGFEFYHIVETNPEKYTSVGAMTVSGTVINNDWIQYVVPIEGKTLTGNKFWDKKEGQPPENHPPVANAGPDQTANVGNVVHLNGSGSSDMDGDPLTYRWSLISVPGGSSAALSNATAVQPTFVVDLPGTYVAQLVVNDGKIDSSPDTVVVIVEGQPPSETGTIRGVKFNDENGDGIWNGPETGMAGWTIFADMDPYNAQLDPGEPSDVTNQSGSYCFVGLAPGVYNVYEVAQSGWQITYPSSGFYGITIQGNDLWDGKDFGNQYRETPPSGEEACCLPDGSCASLTPEQCRLHGGTPQGPGTACMGDANGDGIDDLCGGQPPAGEFDFGDAPRPYPTLHADQGAYHDVNAALCLGLSIDAEPDGQPDASATGDDNHDADDEDDVRFTSSLQAGSQATVQVAVLAPQGTYVNVTGWIDFNADNQWQDPQERIFSENTWAPVTLTKTFTVPSNAQTGAATFARFRLCRADPGADFLPSPLGYGGEGEVEDHQVLIGREGPPSVGESYVFAVCFNVEIALPDGSIHNLSLSGPATGYFHIGSNGQASDTNGNGRDDAPAELMSLQLAGVDPVLGNVRMVLNPAVPSTGQIEERINNMPGVFDVPPFTASGSADSFFDVWFQIDLPSYGLTVLDSQSKRLAGVIDHLPPASNPYSEAVPTTIELVDQNGQLTGIRLGPLTSCQGGYRSDYGDAPAPYPDASHVPGMVWLGFAAPDTDAGTQASPPGEGDDTHGIDDEDGAALMSDLVPGQFAWVGLALSGSNQDLTYAVWIDYNRNGTWEHPAELYASGNAAKLATSPLGVVIANPISAGAQIGTTYMRCRVYPGLNVPVSPTGNAQGGEVEDYQVQIKRTTGQIQPPGHMITGIKFNDLDGDGSWDPADGETCLPNWTIWLDTNNDGTPDKTMQTDSQGGFEFTPVQPGTHTIGEQQQTGWTQTAPVGAGIYTVTVPGGLQPTIAYTMFGNRRSGQPTQGFDFGDAPDPTYPARLVSNGARHQIDPSMYLGSSIDAEVDGQPASTADGDNTNGANDEDGVTMPSVIAVGQSIPIKVIASHAGALNAWIDFNVDGDWTDPGEHFIAAQPVVSGMNTFTLMVPANAQPGQSFARFRFSSERHISFDGEAPDGEVEDYAVAIQEAGRGSITIIKDAAPKDDMPFWITVAYGFMGGAAPYRDPSSNNSTLAGGPAGIYYIGESVPSGWTLKDIVVTGDADNGTTIDLNQAGVHVDLDDGETITVVFKNERTDRGRLDFGDAPDTYKTLLASGGAFHKGGPLTLGTSVDVEADGQPGPDATGDDLAGTDDEEGLVSSLNLTTGKIATVSLIVANADAPNDSGMMAGWIDFDGDGQFDLVSDDIGTQYVSVPGGGQVTVQFSFLVPAGAKAGKTHARFRLYRDDPNPMAMPWAILPTGGAGYGEVEDYVVNIRSGISANDRDYGDAPLPYPSADHRLGGPYLGLFGDLPDRDTGMQREAAALGDDTDADGDDENGLLSVNLVKSPGVWSHAEMKMWTSSTGAFTGAIWIDWNADGDWDDPGELVGSAGLSTTPVPPGGAWLHATWGFPVPSVAKPGNTFARLRVYEGFSVALSPNGPGAAGEVEDHLVQIKASGPGLPPGGIVHGYKWNDQDGDGVWDAAEPGLAAWTIWLDLNGNGSQDAGDRYETTDGNGYFRFTGVPAGTYTVGERPQSGWTQTCPGAPGTYTETVTPGAASVALMFGNTTRPVWPPADKGNLDWGDAPDPTYPTLRASNGAYHVIVPGLQLGGSVAPELDGQPSPDAMGDDLDGSDDEDGVTFLAPLIPGQRAELEVLSPTAGKIDAWIDFAGDGGWTQATDQIANSVSVSGSTVLTFQVPASTPLGTWVFARFRLSTKGGLPFDGPAPDGEVEDYRVWIGEPGPAGPAGGPGLVKWSQPPIEIDPSPDHNMPPVFCGWNEPARSTQRSGSRRQWRMDADDFRCLGPIPITRVRWWGGYKGWTGPKPPALQPETWHIGIWANQVQGLAPDKLYLERLVWSVEVPNERVHREPVGLNKFPQQLSEICFVYEVRLEPEEWFHQAQFASNDGVFWLSITAIYPPDAEAVNQWGWQMRPHVWRDGAVMPAIMGEWPTFDERLFPGRITPIESPLLCGQKQAYDLCFELLTEAPWVKWDQPFTGIRDWPYYTDLESQGTSIQDQESFGRLVADDWVCERDAPVIAAAWWGSYIGYGYEACQCEPSLDLPRPDYFLLTISTNVGPARETDYGRPGDVVWQYRAYDYDEVLVGYDKEPQGEPNEPVFRYSVRLPEDNWFRQEAPGTIYWFSVAAVYTDPLPMIVYPWGWTNHPAVFESAAVFIDYRARPRPEWRPLHDPLDRLVDMSFTLFTRPE